MKIRLAKLNRVFGFGFLTLWVLLSATPSFAGSVTARPYSNNPLVAIIDGKPILMKDLKNAEIHETMVKLHEMQFRTLKEKVLQKLSAKHPFLDLKNIPPVTQAEITDFYKNWPGVKKLGTLKKMEGEIRDYLEKVHKSSFIEEKYQLALKKGWVVTYLTPPTEYRLVAGVGTAALWFEKKAKKPRKIFVLEYSDFQCPFCKRVQSTLSKLRKKYSDQVQFGYRHFPLPFHKEAKSLAEATECARDQGRFWQFQALLYQSPTEIPLASLSDLARRVGVKDIKAFEKCWKSGKYRRRILTDIREGADLGVQGTPSFIIGVYDKQSNTISGNMMSGALPEEKFVRVIEKLLAASQPKAAVVQNPTKGRTSPNKRTATAKKSSTSQ